MIRQSTKSKQVPEVTCILRIQIELSINCLHGQVERWSIWQLELSPEYNGGACLAATSRQLSEVFSQAMVKENSKMCTCMSMDQCEQPVLRDMRNNNSSSSNLNPT